MSDFVAAALGFGNSTSFDEKDGMLIGYKVSQFDPSTSSIISGANSRIKLPINIGIVHNMPGAGIFISNSPEYVIRNYSFRETEEDPQEVIIQYSFDINDVAHNRNQMNDLNPEIGVSRATVLDFMDVEDWNKGKRFK